MIIVPSARGFLARPASAVAATARIFNQRLSRSQRWVLGDLDRTNPLTRDLVLSCYNFGTESLLGPYNVVNKQKGSRSAISPIGSPPMGTVPLFASGSSNWSQLPLDMSNTSEMGFSGWLWWDAFANDNKLALEFTSNVNTNLGAWSIAPNNATAGAFAIFVNAAATSDVAANSFTRPSAAVWHHIAFNITRVTSTLGTVVIPIIWLDGEPQTFAAGANSAANVSGNFGGPSTLNIMSRNAASQFGSGRWAHINIFRKMLNQGQVAMLYNRPNLLVANSRITRIHT